MLQEAQTLLRNGVDVKIGYIETHGRKETQDLLEGLPLIPRRKLFYKGKELEELDVQAVSICIRKLWSLMNWPIPILREVKMKNAGRM